MLHTKFRGNRPAGSGEEDFWRVFTASMTFRWKPFRRMRLPVEPDITSNATFRRIFVERHLVEWTSVEISSKIRRNLVEKWDNAKMKVTYQKSAMRMRLEMTGVIVYTTDKIWCYGSPKKGIEFNRTLGPCKLCGVSFRMITGSPDEVTTRPLHARSSHFQ